MSRTRKFLLIIIILAGIAFFVLCMYVQLKYDLPWFTKKYGPDKTGPWLLGVFGLGASVWTYIEIKLRK
jgi:hypothetical protein